MPTQTTSHGYGTAQPVAAAPSTVRGGHPPDPEYPGPGRGGGPYGRPQPYRQQQGYRQRSYQQQQQQQQSAAPLRQEDWDGAPRQEYLDAFEEEFFPGRRPGPGHPAGGPAHGTGRYEPPFGTGTRAVSAEEDGGAAGGADSTPGTDGADGDDGGADGGADGAERRTSGSRGRTFGGIAAAAVITVLAGVAAGQLTGGEPASEDRAAGQAGIRRAGQDGGTSRSAERTVSPTPDGKPLLSYGTRMAEVFPLDPALRGSGKLVPVGGQEKGPGTGTRVRYRIDVEEGLPLDRDLFVEAVHRTLNDERGWGHGGVRTFDRVSSGPADFVITLASPGTTADWCAKSGLDTSVQNVSCDSAATERIMINAYRWAQGSETFGDQIRAYREMLINHEVGHRLGKGHQLCDRDGALAPVMMQQTKTLTTDGRTCRPNPWPQP